MTQENKKTTELKAQDVTYKVQEFKSLDKSLADMGSDKESMDAQLKAVLEYYAKDRCVAKPEGYEERKRRRDAEVAGLKEALSILESETALVQVRSRRGPPGRRSCACEAFPTRRGTARERDCCGLPARRERASILFVVVWRCFGLVVEGRCI
ncbi:unnamed protein product [Prorocentrum cordatum]|uniref:Uncharacterized protein n=1 Tax=Prorocentrum cordatum TaxID=2364126 RepID=A0ABN9PTI3_9DINO|nr:unnamed protein product [Polarella glacialis]